MLTPDSWGDDLRERWSDAARAASLRARRARAKAKRGPYQSSITTPNYLDAEMHQAEKLGVHVAAWPSSHPNTSRYVSGKTVGVPSRVNKVDLGLKGKSTEVLSTLRHELGHAKTWDHGARPAAPRVLGTKFSDTYGREVLAWASAIKDAPNNRVDWNAVRSGLISYLRQEPATGIGRGYDVDSVRKRAAIVDRHMALLKRFAQSLRRKDTTPAHLRPRRRAA